MNWIPHIISLYDILFYRQHIKRRDESTKPRKSLDLTDKHKEIEQLMKICILFLPYKKCYVIAKVGLNHKG
jgi:hypothetical protein